MSTPEHIRIKSAAAIRVPPFLLRLPENVRQTVQTVALSLAAGLSAVAFLFLTNLLFDKTYVAFAARSKLFFVVSSFALIVLTSGLVGLLLKACGAEAAGSGIPQVKSAFWKELGHIGARPVLAKFLGGVLSIGGGQSLGREGPSVYIGAGVASNASGLLGTPRRERRGAAIVGASAGLAAAFNTPLAAIAFAIEEVIGDLNSRFLGRVVLASVLGAFVVYALLGRQPAFSCRRSRTSAGSTTRPSPSSPSSPPPWAACSRPRLWDFGAGSPAALVSPAGSCPSSAAF